MRKLIPALLMAASLLSATLSAQQVIFADDFSNNHLPKWTITNLSNGGSQVTWKWANSGQSSGTYPEVFNGTGAGNGYIIVDSDADGDQTGDTIIENAIITSKAINCTGTTLLVLKFNEFLRHFSGDTPLVQISNDSVNWTTVHNAATGLADDAATDNPASVSLNVSAVAANQPTVYIRFSWRGGWDYYWFVDDLQLIQPATTDVSVSTLNNTTSNGCTLSNAEPLQIIFSNNGVSNLDSIVVKYSINNAAPDSEKIVFNSPLAYGAQYSYTFQATADFSAVGTYGIAAWVEFAGDTIHTNDTAFSFAISANPITPPYTMGFEVPGVGGTEIGAYTWTTDNVNNDARTWQLSTSSAHAGSVSYVYFYSTSVAADDWLFSPCITLDASKYYRVDYFDRTGNGFPEKLELSAGTTRSAAGMTESLIDYGTITDSLAYVERKIAYKPATSGIHYFGLHAYSDANEYFISIDDFKVDTLPLHAQFGLHHDSASYTISVSDSSTDLITSWQWSWGDGTSSGVHTPSAHVYTQPGQYNVCLVVTNVAGNDTACHTVVIAATNPLGVNEVADLNTQISVYPNPTNKVLNVAINSTLSNTAQIEIVDMLGEVVISRPAKGNTVEKFDLQDIAQGVYFVKINSGGEKAIKKFVYAK